MHVRTKYVEKITPYINKPVIKVITGMRRVGKSVFLKQIMDFLKTKKVNKRNILYINKESLDFDFIKDYHDLNSFVKKEFVKVSGKKYLFIDEVQEIKFWEKAVISFFTEKNIDIYITGSNAHLLSSELATYISGRYVELQIFPLSFEEFLEFRSDKKNTIDDEFANFVKYGGLPVIHEFELKEDVIYPYVFAIYNTILMKDVILKYEIRNPQLLENITKFVFDNIGNVFSAKKISDYLKSQKIKVGVDTIQDYLMYLTSTYMISKVSRYNIKGKKNLEINEKYFLGDIGIRHALIGYRDSDIAGILENIVFLELKRRGYKVSVGKIYDLEVDFIAEKEHEKIYVQVSYLLSSKETIEREFNSLRKIKDNYPKYVLTMDKIFGEDFDGIKRINIIDFLLAKNN
ncbi:MAG: hypothetical protein UR28_C0002G0058 [Candidatus Peregrinibacteria bacterium GW2011_GWF2_33_10]|nr:MAG: hypothetical protein UR28_C0002G0058 [Candidatus Peregrinibacteria bacterium GW2011_GWF2_33_10]OGJ45634.1 MAG: ATPase [Candidatus Peregrinibacteria bacterium RIFOXYA2_FULL_33_21]OGJ46569.1 MAG: ATPase [Candidatus Peregrinibacteria bacterium RIFOXYA12_FULL_33_12]OGJ51225.1 MAG: ATPase [Candidatus Peregrinibacteria bacterium RIFOXYB2_FULL_33_20]